MAAISAAAGLHLFIFNQVQQTGQWRRALLARLGGKAASAGTCQDAATTIARASARIVRMNHSHKIFRIPHPHIYPHAHPGTHVHPPQSDALGFAVNFGCNTAVKWDKA
jgi:hypothetical protein